MKNTQLIIMSIDNHYTVGYTEDGQFVKIPKKPTHQVGQIINYQPTRPHSIKAWKRIAIAAAVLLVFFTGIVNPFFQDEAAAAYLSMGLNTGSLELWTDENNKVIKSLYAKSLGNLNELNLTGKDIYEAVSVLALKAKENGLISEDENNILLVDLIDLQESTNHHISEDKLRKVILENLAADENQCLMMINRHDTKYLSEANELNLNATQYKIYEVSNAKGHNLELEQVKHGHIRTILKEAGTSPEEIFDMHSGMMQNHTNMIQNNYGGMSSPEHHTNMQDRSEMSLPDQNNSTVVPKHNQENMMKHDMDNNFHQNGKMPMGNDTMHN